MPLGRLTVCAVFGFLGLGTWWGFGSVQALAQELPAAPDDRPTIHSVIINCDLPRCQDPDSLARLHSLVDLDPGKPWEPRGGEAACFFLERTGLFLPESCQVTAIETAGDALAAVAGEA